jgi:hypothetical protein
MRRFRILCAAFRALIGEESRSPETHHAKATRAGAAGSRPFSYLLVPEDCRAKAPPNIRSPRMKPPPRSPVSAGTALLDRPIGAANAEEQP